MARSSEKFFYLRDMNFTVRDLLWCFYSQFDPATCTDRFDSRTFYAAMAAKVRATLGSDADRLTRATIELLYPLFRCRAVFGYESSVMNRHGWWFYPFIAPSSVKVAPTAPINACCNAAVQAPLKAMSILKTSLPSTCLPDP